MDPALLALAAKRAAIRPRVEGLAAVPAEPRLRRFARLEAQVNVLRDAVADRWLRRIRQRRGGRSRPAPRARGSRRQHVIEQLARPVVARRDVGRHRLQNDVVDGFGDLRVLQPRRVSSSPFIRRSRSAGDGVVRQHAGHHLVHRHAERVDVRRTCAPWNAQAPCKAADHRRTVGRKSPRDVPKSATLSMPLSAEDVRRAQITVQHALAVRVIDGVADLAGVSSARAVQRSVDDRLERLTRLNSMTMKKTFSCFSAVRMVTMFGWLRLGERVRTARRNRRPACAAP